MKTLSNYFDSKHWFGRRTRGDGGLLGHGAHWNIAFLGSCVFSIRIDLKLKKGSDITWLSYLKQRAEQK